MLNLGRITNIHVENVTPQWSAEVASLPIPGGLAINYANGVPGERYTISCVIAEGCRADSIAKLQQVRELYGNPGGYPFHYLYFTEQFQEFNGFYAIANVSPATLVGTDQDSYRFDLEVVQLASGNEKRLATYWDAVAETYTGWGALSTLDLVSLPNGASNIAWATFANRTGPTGTITVLEAPTRQTLAYKLPDYPGQWYKMEPQVLDTRKSTREMDWVQVFGANHKFEGDCVFQNGLLRYRVTNGVGTWYVYDSLTTHQWLSIGELRVSLTGNLLTTIIFTQLLPRNPTSESIQWVEYRMNGVNPVRITWTLRRGTYHARAVLETFSLGIDTATYVQLYGADYFAQLFNASANGAGGAGDLAADATHNYHCGYNTARNVVAGFVLCDKPSFQPKDSSANVLAESGTWGVGVTAPGKTFFVIGWPQATNPFVIATGRSNAYSIAKHCMESVEQELVLVPSGFYA